ncbi:MAG: hypothetical protein AAF702_05070 [Chloroflexota bacterium]
MPHRPHAKIFYDLNAAEAFGEAIDTIAGQSTVATSAGGNTKSIFFDDIHSRSSERVGEYHHIDRDSTSPNQDMFYVRYYTHVPRGAARSEALLVEREATEYLDERYAQVGPDIGLSRS